ncbi:MAG: carbamoyltransferase HypF [Terracidiphilus sp.]|nr:carbamoyltransferase HypF [Terracidiphilus sp.]
MLISCERRVQMQESGRERARYEVLVQGVVQGVGFRPFVYRLATEEALGGAIGNDTDGVTIEIEGERERLDAFLLRLRAETPPLARIDAVAVRELEIKGESHFRIVSSAVHGRVATGIPADAATCGDCLRELLDPKDRRYRYPFLNCTNCGPRFTITRRIPYDRPQTSMAVFPMCAECQREYDDPLNRRFHAQPNACAVCGPRVWLANATGDELPCDDPVRATIDALMAGKIAAIKGIGGFHLSVDATNEEAVVRLRERKHRYGKPLAVMVRDLEAARELCALTEVEEKLLAMPARPIVLARMREGTAIADSVAPGLPWLGVFLPYAPLQHLLFADARVRALVMTSANLSEEPICIANEEACARLGSIADVFLLHNREILQRCDDSVAAVVDGAPQLVRRARGYVPLAVDLPVETPPLLAVGGHLKSVFTLARGRFAYQSQHLGDLENLTGIEFFEESLEHLMRTFEIEPAAVVHDLHPAYLSTGWAKRWAEERNLPLVAVQHHHAHVAACMAEHGVTEPVIGLALDGTGYGVDGKIWGGEVLIARLGDFERFAHLAYAPLPGGEKAIREPWRMALGALQAAGFDVQAPEIFSLVGATREEARIVARMMERGLNAPLTSSCGRLFDAVAAVVLGRRAVDYEAQAAIELEGAAVDEPMELDSPYALEIAQGDWEKREVSVLSADVLWRQILGELRAGVSKARIAARFHAAVAAGFVRAAVLARAATGIGQVALSGGCMHNRRLAELLRRGLEGEEFRVLRHERVSPGDGGLSYGQAVVAAARLAGR